MTLIARDLLSDTTIEVAAESRLVDALDEIGRRQATHAAVFDGAVLRGVVPLQTILASPPQRIFADLLPRLPLRSVLDSTPIEVIGAMMETATVDGLEVVDERGEFLGVITRTSLLGALLAESRARLDEIDRLKVQQERLRVIGQMTSGVVHDLNNLLMPILGYLELALSGPQLEEHERTGLKTALVAASDAAAAVKRLQTFHQPESSVGDGLPIDLAEVAREVRSFTRPKWRNQALVEGRHIEFLLEVEDGAMILGNPGEIREVVTNLVFNAIDAVQGDGQVSVCVRKDEQDAILEVRDTGMGMTVIQRQRCFEPFYTTKGTSGTGLGLALCAEIIARHDGTIDFDSLPGRGSRFRICLPLADPDTTAPTPKTSDAPLSRWRVLYIDDETVLLRVVAKILDRLDQEAATARSGAEGLKMFRAAPHDLVITDQSMPGMDGFKVTEAVKTIDPRVPVVMFTGWAPSARVEESTREHVPDLVLPKPVTMEGLRDVLHKLQTQRREDERS